MSFEYIKIQKNKFTFSLIEKIKSNFEEISAEDMISFYEYIKEKNSYPKSLLGDFSKIEEKDLYSLADKRYPAIKQYIKDIFEKYIDKVFVPLINFNKIPEMPSNIIVISEEGFILIISVNSSMYAKQDEFCFINIINRFNLLGDL